MCDARLDIDMVAARRTNIRLDGTSGQIENISINKLKHAQQYSYTVNKFAGSSEDTFFELWYMKKFTNVPLFPDHPEVSLNKIMKYDKGVIRDVGESKTF